MNIKEILHKKVEIIDVIESIMRALEQFDEYDVTVAMEMFKENLKQENFPEMNDEERIITGLITLIVGNLGEKTELSEQEVDFVIRIALKAGNLVRKKTRNKIRH